MSLTSDVQGAGGGQGAPGGDTGVVLGMEELRHQGASDGFPWWL